MTLRIDASEHFEKVSFSTRRIQNPGITQRHRKDTAESGDKDEASHHGSGAGSIEFANELGHDGMRNRRLAPRNDTNDYNAHHEVQNGNNQNRKYNRARNIFRRIFHLATEVRNVVVASVVVHGDQCRASETIEKRFGKMKRPCRKIESHLSVDVNQTRTNYPDHSNQNHGEQDQRKPAHGLDRSIKQEGYDNADSGGERTNTGVAQPWKNISSVFRKTDAGRGNPQWRDEDGLP